MYHTFSTIAASQVFTEYGASKHWVRYCGLKLAPIVSREGDAEKKKLGKKKKEKKREVEKKKRVGTNFRQCTELHLEYSLLRIGG